MPDNRPIGVFDSGLGGLTVVKELKKSMPGESFVYFGDTGRVPYGTRSNETILRYAREDEAFLLSRDVKMIVAACGTVSSVAYMTAKDLPVPFFEVVTPAAEHAARVSKSGRIGVIGTPATINSRAHAGIILKASPQAEITAVACPLFVPLVEEGWISPADTVTRNIAARYLEPVVQAGVDTLILGCTHYPALRDVIADILGAHVALIDAGTATAACVQSYLRAHDMQAETIAQSSYYVSDRAASFSKIAGILLGEDIETLVQQVDIYKYI